MSHIEFPGKAGRFLFKEDEPYAGKLIAVTKRRIGNTNPRVALLRLEFVIFYIVEDTELAEFHPTGGVASQDVVVTDKALSDKGLKEYAEALRVKRFDDPKHWYVLERYAQSTTLKNQRWIRIRFGKPDMDLDFRQPFEDLRALPAPSKGQIKLSSTAKAVRDVFVGPEQVRLLLRNKQNKSPGVDKVNSFVDGHRRRYGKALVRRTPGGGRLGNRQINWYLCWHLWEAERLGAK